MNHKLQRLTFEIPHNSSPLRVLVVDDEELIASTLAAMLTYEGYQATYFTNPLSALSSARRDAPDILISDVSMPQLSGIELAIQFKTAAPRCRVLLFSGQIDHQGLLHFARDLGYDFEILPKPIHPKELLSRIKRPKDLSTSQHHDTLVSSFSSLHEPGTETINRLSAHS